MNIKNFLSKKWKESGVLEGDLLLLHSNIKRTLRAGRKLGVRISPLDILESFLLALGDEGTLIVPLFNFEFCEGAPFDIRNTPSQMGILTEKARNHNGVIRTGHPVDNYNAYGKDSPFAIIKSLGGKIGVLNLPGNESMTFYHHVEEMEKVKYRYHKEFSGSYINFNGILRGRQGYIKERNTMMAMDCEQLIALICMSLYQI